MDVFKEIPLPGRRASEAAGAAVPAETRLGSSARVTLRALKCLTGATKVLEIHFTG